MSRAGLLNCLAGFLVRIGGYPVNPAAVALAIVVIWMR